MRNPAIQALILNRALLMFAAINFSLTAYSQDSLQTTKQPVPFSISLNGYKGSFLTTVPKAEYVRDSYASFAEVAVMFQSAGTRDWQVRHHYPSWGIALIHGNTGSREFIGKMTALYLLVELPLVRSNRYTLNLRAGAGPGIVDKPYDIVSNPKNTMIGTKLNAFINAGFINELRISEHVQINAGISFMHLSNGGTTLPNLGLNTPGVTAGLRYSVVPVATKNTLLKEGFTPETVIRVQTAIALRQASRVGGNHYLINLVQAEGGRRINPNHYFGGGLQVTYNRSLDYFPLEGPLDPVKKKKLQVGLYGSYEHHFGKLSFPFQVGVYIYNKNLYPVLFQQYGARFQVNKHFDVSMMLKSHLGKADFIHTGIGYKF